MDNSEDSGTGPVAPPQVDFEALVKLSKDALVVLALDGTPLFVSPASEQLFGWGRENLPDQLAHLVYTGGGNPDAVHLQDILSGNSAPDAPLPQAELQFRSASGPLVWAEASTHLLRNAALSPYAFAVYFRNIARQKALEHKLDSVVQTDSLTGLFNRRAFDGELQREWAIALREKTHTSLIKVSLDRFEALEEHFGPGTAKDCLTRVAETLKETARRPADIVARTAASEFSLLLPRTHELGSETIGAYIQLAIHDLGIPNPENSAGNGTVTASVGAACAVVEKAGVTETSECLLSAAEECVFQARREGGNRVKTMMKYLGR